MVIIYICVKKWKWKAEVKEVYVLLLLVFPEALPPEIFNPKYVRQHISECHCFWCSSLLHTIWTQSPATLKYFFYFWSYHIAGSACSFRFWFKASHPRIGSLEECTPLNNCNNLWRLLMLLKDKSIWLWRQALNRWEIVF